MDAKIDMLHRTGAIGKTAALPTPPQSQELEDIDEEEAEIERNLVSDRLWEY